MMNSYKEIDSALLDSLATSFDLLVVTATAIEERVLHQHMKPLVGEDKLLHLSRDKNTYYLGVFGAYNVVHVACGEMGARGRSASAITTVDAIRDWSPKAVLMVGIAFGMDSDKQAIGDVLVAERVYDYEPRRIGKDIDVPRGKEGPASSVMVNRFRTTKGWTHVVEAGRTAKIEIGSIVSGEKLIDNPEFKASIKQEARTAIGGEMEGVGIYAACDNRVSHWILVKAICDFADGNKKENKERNQELATESAVSLCEYVFSSEMAFKDIGLNPRSISRIDALNLSTDASEGIPQWMRLRGESLKRKIGYED